VRNGCWFDEGRAAYAVGWFYKYLQLSDGEWAGKPFELLEWQREEIIYPLFGWMRKDERGRVVRRFDRTYVEIPKKNGKSTLASGIGLYMLVGEGNRGAEVYSAATDRDQASIVHGEAIKMVEASPALFSKVGGVLNVNYSTKHIYNHELGLCYRVLSSRPQGNEGLKGNCCIIDELHAWYGDELWNALRYMGIHWPERLIFVITTAGNDTESVCYRQYEHAKQVANGEVENERLLVCIHEALEHEDISDPVIQHRVNPSLGHTILQSDLDIQIAEASLNPRELASLKRYRFNIWSSVGDPWLDAGVWKSACRESAGFEPEDCVIGLDLARVSDMSAAAVLLSDGQRVHVIPHFWLPEARAKSWAHLASFQSWARSGHLTLTPGDVADYMMIEKDIAAIIERYGATRLVFDPHYAEEITQRLADSTGIDRISFTQSMSQFKGPTAEFERRLIEGSLTHDGNPVLSWQASHVCIKQDTEGGRRPMRFRDLGHRSIDGIVAAIMGLAAFNEPRQTMDYYESHALEML
jgi:phage terminase large subunit-like protein